MEIVTGDHAPTLEHTEAVRLLQEMAAVVRTIFAVDAAPQKIGQQAAQPEIHPTTVPAAPVTRPTTPPASIPVPGVAMLQEIAFLDD
ncbi:hypothetical protein [Nocardioides sp. HB32]